MQKPRAPGPVTCLFPSRRQCASRWLALGLATALSACSGHIDGDTAGPSDPGTPGPDRPPDTDEPGGAGSRAPLPPGGGAAPGSVAAARSAGPLPLRGLTRTEYVNTVRTLIGVEAVTAADLPIEERGAHGFANAIVVSETSAERYLDAAVKAADAALKAADRLVPCALDAADEACARAFIERFGQRAFRRPLDAEAVGAYVGLYRRAAADGARPAERIRVLVEALLMAPEFLYLGPASTAGRPGDTVPLDGWEVASRLSYALWATMPDDELFRAAEADALTSPAAVEKQARRLLADARAGAAVHEFFEHWAELEAWTRVEKDGRAFPQFNDALKGAMRREFDELVQRVVLEGDGRLGTLLTAPVGYVDAALAKLYGVPAPMGGGVARVSLEGKARAGLFTQGAFLSMHASNVDSDPIRRGKVMFSQVLCGTMPPPPPEIPEPRKASPTLTTRERYAEHGKAACARACHALLDPLGFAFENYDAVGAYRTMEAGKPVDATGEVIFPTGGARPFKDALELMSILAKSPEVHACVARQLFRFTAGRQETEQDEPSLAMATETFARADGDLRELLVALVRSPAFLHRKIPSAEVSR